MNCPVCSVPLQMTERQGVEIDYCPQCRGVWLDRGELDKLVERSATWQAAPTAPSSGYPRDPERRYYDDDDDDDHRRYPRKRRGLLGELFDF